MNGILLVSHSKKITDGLKEMIEEMIGINSKVNVYSLGGMEDGRLGTSAIKILDRIQKCKDFENIFIFCDIGSAILSAEVAIDMSERGLLDKIELVDAPLIEGSFSVAVQASVMDSKDEILKDILAY
ncbi:dihydroxyacetone kinase phosphoryl donor subunit DhaM [Enterococcus xiangfangensis]|uniref:phosphoenolpyruvate--glycerone phosphotransferase n=1 Tax=Enterococcus xiangfangensis TaxID=1296537 RepID=A0ABU3FB94_9ENTE|nr:dihydroxyacetone kinase phosphoryl donor subunit DhaM [Enterococcus xiangfangensis]MDT2759911.1 dihydroxyacetone kinase phosphoryl donor subunit DhaM [Enterococcus xiangfangensis]